MLTQVNLLPAAADCEAISSHWWGQPVNTATATAFLVAGVVVLARRRAPMIGLALALTGVGSILFHGPMPSWAEWAHDFTLTWLIVVLITTGTRWQRLGGWPALLALALVIYAVPELGDPIAVALSGVGVIRLVRIGGAQAWAGLVVLAAGGVIGRLSATGGPWCRPASLLQGHGLWHLTAATAVVLLAAAIAQRRSKNTPPSPQSA